jgi:hypothetical protein
MSRRSEERTATLVATAVREAAREFENAKQIIDPTEAEEIRDAAAKLREQRRTGRMIYRLRRHLYPWKAAAALLAATALLWGIGLFAPTVAVLGGVLVAGLAAGGGLIWAKRAGQWATRVKVGGVVAALWVLGAAVTGPSWMALFSLALSVVCVSAGYWRATPIGIKNDEDDEGPIRVESVVQLWRQFVANQNGALPESILFGEDTKTDSNLVTYTVQLRRGRETVGTALGKVGQIASAIDIPARNFLVEPHPNESPSQLRLTIVKQSPIAKTVEYQGPRTSGGVILPGAWEDESVPLPDPALIHIGPYADGKGYAPWRIWTPGEKPNDGSAWGGFIGGGMGAGKSRTLEVLCIGAMSFGFTETWFLDPQNGASSPALKEAADWYGDLGDAGDLLEGLEGFIDMRGKEMGYQGWQGFDPSPERPLLHVVIDECHEVFGIKEQQDRWVDVSRKIRKVGGAITCLSQYFGVKTFGGREELRSSQYGGNIIVMRTESKHQGQLIPNLDLDPLSLPPKPGYGITVARGGSVARTAMYRAEYVKDPAAWLRTFPGPGLDKLASAGAGDLYLERHARAEEKRNGLRESIELVLAGGKLPSTRDKQPTPQTASATTQPASTWFKPVDWGKPLLVVDNTKEKAADEITGDSAREVILSFLRVHGQGKKEALQAAADVSETRTRQVLNKLIQQGHVIRADHGWYRLAPAKQPVR